MIALAALSAALAAPCEGPMTADDLRAACALAREGFAAIGCLGEPLGPEDAARFHEVMTLAAFHSRADVAAVHSIQAALSAAPERALPADLIPQGHALRFQYDLARSLAASPRWSLAPMRGEWITVDGASSESAPTDRPAVLQRHGAGGEVLESVYWTPGEPAPAWTMFDTASTASREGALRGPAALGVASLGLLATGAGLYGVALHR